MTHDEMIEVLTAYRDGKAVQFWDTFFNDWLDVGQNCSAFNFHHFKYRIKPEQKKPREWHIDLTNNLAISGLAIDFLERYPHRFVHVREVLE
jgi:hypothetical protein